MVPAELTISQLSFLGRGNVLRQCLTPNADNREREILYAGHVDTEISQHFGSSVFITAALPSLPHWLLPNTNKACCHPIYTDVRMKIPSPPKRGHSKELLDQSIVGRCLLYLPLFGAPLHPTPKEALAKRLVLLIREAQHYPIPRSWTF